MSGALVFWFTFLTSVVFLCYVFISRGEVRGFIDQMSLNDQDLALKQQARELAKKQLADAKAAAAAAREAAKARKKMSAEEAMQAEIEEAADEAEEEAPSEEEEEEEEDDTPVDESDEGFKQSKVQIMKFLEQSLAGMMQGGMKLDGISKFGCHLFLAGASEALGRASGLGEKEFVKILHKVAEEARVSVRHARQEARDEIKHKMKDHEVPEDEGRKQEAEAQKLTDQYIKQIEELLKHKEEEVMQV